MILIKDKMIWINLYYKEIKCNNSFKGHILFIYDNLIQNFFAFIKNNY